MAKTVQLSLVIYAISALIMYLIATFSILIPDWIGARKTPYACDDYSIRNPYKKQSVSTTALVVGTVLIAPVIILITELIIDRFSGSDYVFKYRRFTLPALLVHVVAYVGYFQLGYVMQVVVNQVTKYAVGRLRPHFLTVCLPSPANCTAGELIYDYTCTGDVKKVDEGRLSFYSGHSSISMYTATFLAIYLHARIGHLAPRIVLSTVQTLLFSGGLFICYTRIQDYFHHPSDVATGVVIGILGAIYACYAWTDLWRKADSYSPVHGKITDEDEDQNNNTPSSVKVFKPPTSYIDMPSSTQQPSTPPGAQLYPVERL